MIQKQLADFVNQRDWEQFHSPENLAKSISIESAELLEHFQWSGDGENKTEVLMEIADILIYCYLLLNYYGKSPDQVIGAKMIINEERYPINKCKGKSDKYNKI